MPYKQFPVSFSRLSSYKNCAKKFLHTYVLEDVKEDKSVAADFGVRAHQAIEDYLREDIPLPEEFIKYKMMVDHSVKRLKGVFDYERKLAKTRINTVSDWDGEDSYYRGIIDLMCIHPDNTATILDWKTGRPSMDDRQLRLFAGLVFIHYPQITEVTTQYIWLAYNSVSGKKYSREDPSLWQWLDTTVEELSNETLWLPTPSGLCKQYCSVTECEHNGKNNKARVSE